MSISIPLSKLVASRTNPRRVQPERDAHRRLVASLRAHGLLEPLVVRPEGSGVYRVIAGNRRLAALRVVHGREDVKVPCVVRNVDAQEAEALSVAENFIREPMHPLDESEAFARLASVERKGIAAIAAEFGVSERYVRQRMMLADLSDPIKDAYRSGMLDTAAAAMFAAIPASAQQEVWNELEGAPRDAEQIKDIIESQWIDADYAIFPVDSLPAGSVTTDLFQDVVLVERKAFMQAQADALIAERDHLLEEGWSEVVITDRRDIQDRLYSMIEPEPEFTEEERQRLQQIEERRSQLDEAAEDESTSELTAIDTEENAIIRTARARVSEATRSRATVFLTLSLDGQVGRQVRVPRAEPQRHNGQSASDAGSPVRVLTSNDLSERQHDAYDAHEVIAVRHAVANSAIVRRRLLVLALHNRVCHNAIALRQDTNVTTQFAKKSEGFTSTPLAELKTTRDAIDPFKGEDFMDEEPAYRQLVGLSEEALDQLIAILIADSLTGHGQRATPLISALKEELGVPIRRQWTPDAGWLAGFQRIQLAHLMAALRGPAHGSAALTRKKSELVEELATLFTDAAEGRLTDPELADRVNSWVPDFGK